MATELVQKGDWLEEGESLPEEMARAVTMDSQNLVYDFDREVITGNIVHYSATLQTGPGPYDRIGIHRVVRETRPFRPVRTRKALFMLHGDLKRFETMFLPGQYSPNLPDDFGIAAYLARHDIDVWGIDQAWNFIPPEETNFSFFQDWGIQKEADHLSLAVEVARLSRWMTGNDLDRILLLGYSSGCVTGYALLNEEAQMPEDERQIKGYIAADCGVRSDNQDWIDSCLPFVSLFQSIYDSGQYQDPLIFRDVSDRARTDPDGASPYIPGLTNLQCALFFGGGQIWPPTWAHYHAPVMQEGLPVDLQFVTIDQWLDFLDNTASYEPILFELECNILLANMDSPYVSHLSQVTVPVLDIGGAGGIAPYTAATVGYLGSTDITQLYVSVGAPEPALDYGHIDIFTGSNSPQLVWHPIAQWVIHHSQRNRDAMQEEELVGSE
ncbi:MAG: hypothetical protein ACE15D_04475 [Candidatus Eisenbacteria bacterium]